MDPIRDTAGLWASVPDRSKKKDVKKKERTGSLFRSLLGESQEAAGSRGLGSLDGSLENLEDALDQVHSFGSVLKEEPTPSNIQKYRRAVKDFMAIVVKNSLEVKTEDGRRFHPLKKQKRYTLVRVVDQKLDQLAAGILQNQLPQLEILRKVEEIQGLLVDLMS